MLRTKQPWATVLVGCMACAGTAWAGGQGGSAPPVIAPPPPVPTLLAPGQAALTCPSQIKPVYPAAARGASGTVRAQLTVQRGRVVGVELLTPRGPFDTAVVTAVLGYECIDTAQTYKAVQEFNFMAPVPAPAQPPASGIIAVAAPPVMAPPPLTPRPLADVAAKPDAAAIANLMVNDSWNEIQGMLGVMFTGLEAQFKAQGEMTRAKTIMLEELRNALTRDLMVRVFSNGLSEQMTDAELAEVLAYYRSPAGRKMAVFGRTQGRDPRFIAALLYEVCGKTLARLDALGESDPGLALMCKRK